MRAYLGHAVERVDGEHESLALDHGSLFSSKTGFHAILSTLLRYFFKDSKIFWVTTRVQGLEAKKSRRNASAVSTFVSITVCTVLCTGR
jgi:hypothetical protein